MRSSIVALLVCSACARPGLDDVYGKALAGDERAALTLLGRSAPAGDKERRQRQCLVDRFVAGIDPPLAVDDPWVATVVGAYRDYWRHMLLGRTSARAGEARLLARLNEIVQTHNEPFSRIDDATEALGPLFEAHGFHSLRGVTAPYQELMLWRGEERHEYPIALPETTAKVPVVFMRDFVVLGWSAFATCDAAHTGGWTKDGTLYCTADSYDTASEAFAVSYLAHEGQHFVDNERFPALEQPELEYRAKLVELALARSTARALVQRFVAGQGKRRSAPHAFADGRVIADLARAIFGHAVAARAWSDVSVDEINGAARKLLLADTARRVASGTTTTSRP